MTDKERYETDVLRGLFDPRKVRFSLSPFKRTEELSEHVKLKKVKTPLFKRPNLFIADDMEENTMKNQPYNAIAVSMANDEIIEILVSSKEPFLAHSEENARTQFLLEHAMELNSTPSDRIKVIVRPF